jgi:Uma2 family endonuclease
MSNLILDCQSVELTDEQFYQLCINNRDLRFERNAQGNIVIMTPVGDESSNRNGRLTQQLFNWSDIDGKGIAFDSSAGFKLVNGATRSPDASWISLDKWQIIPESEREKFSHICPDFVVELMSPSDSLKETQDKMEEYMENGSRLGWLINRKKRQVEIYRQAKDVEILNNPSNLSGEDILVGFVLNLERIW